MDKEDRDRLARIECGVENILIRVNDHGTRIRSLEALKYKVAGALTLAGVLAGVSKNWIAKKLAGGS